MLFEVCYLGLWLPHEKGMCPISTDEGIVGVVKITILLIDSYDFFKTTKSREEIFIMSTLYLIVPVI